MVKDHFNKMQKINSGVSMSIKLYGEFLISVLNEYDEGIEYIIRFKLRIFFINK